MQYLLTVCFSPNKLTKQQQYFVINLLRKNVFIINIAFSLQNFHFQYLFSFIGQVDNTYDKLNGLQDILLPFCKKFPHKLLGIIASKSYIQDILLKHIYTKHIFKILYTAVFCCSRETINEIQNIIDRIIQHLINSIFQFGPLPTNRRKALPLLDYGQVTLNLKDFLSDLTINLGSVQIQLVLKFIQMLDSKILTKLIQYFCALRQKQQYEEYCEGLILIQLNLIKLLQAFKLTNCFPSGEKAIIRQHVEKSLCQSVKFIASKLSIYTEYLLQKGSGTLNSSSGERIPIVGLIRYRTLELVQKLLSINQLQNIQIDYGSFDLIPVIQLFVQRYKWNSIIHILLIKVTQLIISQDYRHFRRRHIEIQTQSQGLFGSLIANFRNRKHIFLHSMKMVNQGNRSPIFQISKTLINQMQDNSDLGLLIKNFRLWKQFMECDMKEFQEQNYQDSKYFQEKSEIKEMSQNRTRRLTETPVLEYHTVHNHHRPLETIQQILSHLRDEQKWSPRLNIPPKIMNRADLLQSELIKGIDSMAGQLCKNQSSS